jgi:hypothetical protein
VDIYSNLRRGLGGSDPPVYGPVRDTLRRAERDTPDKSEGTEHVTTGGRPANGVSLSRAIAS